MTSYEYRCDRCGSTHFDERPMQVSDEIAGSVCSSESCGGSLRRVWSASIVWPMQRRGH